MTYHTVTLISQYTAFAIFIGLFLAVLVYAFRPANKRFFDRAANIPNADDRIETNSEKS